MIKKHKILETIVNTFNFSNHFTSKTKQINTLFPLSSERKKYLYYMALEVDNRPFTLANGYGFRSFFKEIGVQNLDRHSISAVVRDICDLVKENVKIELSIPNVISLYMDHASFGGSKYISIWITYISESFDCKKILIDFCDVPNKCSNTTYNILLNTMNDYNINSKVSFCINDSAHDLSCAMKNFRTITHVQCFAHKTHNTVINSVNSNEY